MFDVLVAGEINPDLVLTGNVMPEFGQVEKLVERAALTIGSSSAIFACGAARLGLKVAFIGICGEDVFGRFMLEEMQKRDVDTTNVIVQSNASTGLSVILSRGADRAILTFTGLISALRASDVSESLLRQARHLHVASYFLQTNLQPDLPALFGRAHSLGLTTSLDTNYDPSGIWPEMDELLRATDVLLPNQAEALCITRTEDVETASRELAHKATVVAVKCGADGAVACSQDLMIQAEAIPVPVADSVGAGDSFDAGFLFGYLHQWSLDRSLRLACACGGLSMRAAGGTNGQPGLDEALQYVTR